jgi:hypothetical protein
MCTAGTRSSSVPTACRAFSLPEVSPPRLVDEFGDHHGFDRPYGNRRPLLGGDQSSRVALNHRGDDWSDSGLQGTHPSLITRLASHADLLVKAVGLPCGAKFTTLAIQGVLHLQLASADSEQRTIHSPNRCSFVIFAVSDSQKPHGVLATVAPSPFALRLQIAHGFVHASFSHDVCGFSN